MPKPNQIAEGFLHNGRQFFQAVGAAKYQKVLIELAQIFTQLKTSQQDKLKNAPIFVGLRNNDENEITAQLCKASECYLIDNTDYQVNEEFYNLT
jgi:hypothetical protein